MAKNFSGKDRIELCAKSLISLVYDLLARHTIIVGLDIERGHAEWILPEKLVEIPIHKRPVEGCVEPDKNRADPVAFDGDPIEEILHDGQASDKTAKQIESDDHFRLIDITIQDSHRSDEMRGSGTIPSRRVLRGRPVRAGLRAGEGL